MTGVQTCALPISVAAYPVSGPIDVIKSSTGVMDSDINKAIHKALELDRSLCEHIAKTSYTWSSAWNQFKNNLINHEDDDTPTFF